MEIPEMITVEGKSYVLVGVYKEDGGIVVKAKNKGDHFVAKVPKPVLSEEDWKKLSFTLVEENTSAA